MEEKRFLAQTLSHPLHIERVVSAFYSDLTRDFVSCGETHDFWEFVYVDRGHLHVETSRRTYPLAQGQITFHPPMEYHRHIASPEYATSLCIVSFHCSSSVLEPLAHRTLTLDDVRRRALSQALKYATDLFSSVVDAHDLLYLVKKADVNGIQEQLFTNALESFLLLCALEAGGRPLSQQPASATARSRTEQLGQRAVDYLAAHLMDPLSIPELCTTLGCSKTTLSTTFRAYTGSSVVPYFNRLKIEAAKHMIRFDDLSFTQIAVRLNFCNLNYFSTAFKRCTGMYPREYAKSLKVHNGVYLVNPEHDALVRHD